MDELIKIFADILRTDPLHLDDETSPDNNANWDSLHAMMLVSAIEEAFSVELSTAEIMGMRTIGLVRSVLRRKGIVNI